MRALLFVAFVVVPLIELAVILQVGQLIGAPATIVLLVGMSLLGAWLVRHEGLRAWLRFREALAEARLPATEVVDGALVLVAGTLMLTPGFVTDIVGLLLLFPLSRTAVNRLVRGRVVNAFGGMEGQGGPRRRPGGAPPRPGRPIDDGDVVDVEVVSVERDEKAPPEER